MKRILTLTFAIILLIPFGFAQKSKDLKFEEVKDIGLTRYIDIKEPAKSMRMESGLLIEIEPVDAASLNDMFYENYKYSGNYNFTFYDKKVQDHFLNLKKRKRRYLKSEDEFLYEGLYFLLDNDDIDEETYEKFVAEVALGSKEEEEEVEEDFYTDKFKENFNPFFLDKNYLNTFKITIRNPGNVPIPNDLIINVYNAGESLQFIDDEIIDNYYGHRGNIKLQNLLRVNISNKKIFPGNSTTVGYFGTLPISFRENNLSVSVSDERSTSNINWDADIKVEPFDRIRKFYEIRLKPSTFTFRSYYVVDSSSDDIYVVGNYLYISEADIDKDIVIHYYGMLRKRLYHGKTEPIKVSEYLDFQKMKRDKVKVPADYISEVKRTEKSE